MSVSKVTPEVLADIIYDVLSGCNGRHESFTKAEIIVMIETEQFSTRFKVHELTKLIRTFLRQHSDMLGGMLTLFLYVYDYVYACCICVLVCIHVCIYVVVVTLHQISIFDSLNLDL